MEERGCAMVVALPLATTMILLGSACSSTRETTFVENDGGGASAGATRTDGTAGAGVGGSGGGSGAGGVGGSAASGGDGMGGASGGGEGGRPGGSGGMGGVGGSGASGGSGGTGSTGGTSGTGAAGGVGGFGGAPPCMPGNSAGTGGGAGSCSGTFADCDGVSLNGCEADVSNDGANCGSCGNQCVSSCSNGKCVWDDNILLTNERALDLVVDGSEVFWISQSEVRKVAICGGTVETLATSSPQRMAQDADYVYWTSSSVVRRVKKDGTGVPPNLVEMQTDPYAIAVDDQRVYWTDHTPAGSVLSVPNAGGTPLTHASGQNNPRGLAVDADGLYWVNEGAGQIMRAPFGVGPEILATGEPSPLELVVSGSNLYFVRTDGTIRKMPRTGGTPTTVAAICSFFCFVEFRLATDATHLYFLEYSSSIDGVSRLPLAGGSVEEVTNSPDPPSALAVGPQYVYWANESFSMPWIMWIAK